MTYLYIDESGDLGFNTKGSEYFIITCVKIVDEKTNSDFKRIPKKIKQKRLSKKYRKMPELKFSNSSEIIREQFLLKAANLDLEVYSIIIKKEYTDKELQNNLQVLYNYLIKILLESILTKTKDKKLNICLDKCMSCSQREKFEDYIKTEFFSIFKKIPDIHITHECSQNNEGLQVTDFVCGALGYKYNTAKMKGNFERYTELIKLKIIIEKNDLFKKR